MGKSTFYVKEIITSSRYGEIVEGLKNGLDLEEVKTYAGNELPASRMRTMRIQLEESKAKKKFRKMKKCVLI